MVLSQIVSTVKKSHARIRSLECSRKLCQDLHDRSNAGVKYHHCVVKSAFTAVVTPDLDVRHRDTHSETIMRWSGGCIVGAIWNLLWLPYDYIIPRHRHPLSHWPILSTTIR
jgi:uncharacterized metal-binding protein